MSEDRKIVKQVENAKLYSDGTISISNCRASYPHVDKKWAKNPGKDTPRYSITGILSMDTHAEAIALCREVAEQVRKEGKLKPNLKDELYFIRDGAAEKKPEYEGAWIVASGETQRPAVLRRDKTRFDSPEEIADTILPGCRIDLLIEPWAQDNEHGQRVNASLRGVRYLRMVEGEEIGEGGIDEETVASSFDDDGDGGFGDDDGDMGGL
jgi:hypothetical protein